MNWTEKLDKILHHRVLILKQVLSFQEQAATLTVLSKQVEIFGWCVLVHILVAVVLVTNRICLIYKNIIHMFAELQN